MRRSRDHALMSCAWAFSERSTCDRYPPESHVGVVIARDGRILVSGYNGAPAGMPHCDHTCPCTHMPDQLDPAGEFTPHSPQCPLKPCRNAVHAEANAIAWAARNGVRVEDATLFTTLSPCFSCAQLIVNAGIVRVVYAKAYRIAEGRLWLAQAGVEVVNYASPT